MNQCRVKVEELGIYLYTAGDETRDTIIGLEPAMQEAGHTHHGSMQGGDMAELGIYLYTAGDEN